MRTLFTFGFVALLDAAFGQLFTRSELNATLNTPWEITYGPDNFLWVSEAGGKISRIDPASGSKTVVYTAADYFNGATSEQCQLCYKPQIGSGTLGMALHPDFLNPSTSYIYYLYSYNSGSASVPATKFKVVRLKWDASTSSVIGNTDLITMLPTGYDHLGGRLMAVKQNNICYIYVSMGDNGVSETNYPTCYASQNNNPNILAQDPNYKNGKIHRFNIDGTIPADNPIPGNSFFTRGHRNPQGLIFNPNQNIMYNVEHGDQTDDEINVLKAGMNYGWKYVRGYHADNNYPGEMAYVSGYTPHPSITNDALVEAMYPWCATPQPTSTNNSNWCTVAPSDGIYYNTNGIPGWNNSLLVVTLKDGASVDQEMYLFHLNPNGTSLAPSTSQYPNPQKFFGSDQALNGRLRDIALSPDGKTIYLINNGGANRDKVSVYKFIEPGASADQGTASVDQDVREIENMISNTVISPNPCSDHLSIECSQVTSSVRLNDLMGNLVKFEAGPVTKLETEDLAPGIYFINIDFGNGRQIFRKVMKN